VSLTGISALQEQSLSASGLTKEIGSRMKEGHQVQVIAFTGGKGGVGKTNLSVNLSSGLAELGK
jgi:Mrp family chromosome partitioning ATPase